MDVRKVGYETCLTCPKLVAINGLRAPIYQQNSYQHRKLRDRPSALNFGGDLCITKLSV